MLPERCLGFLLVLVLSIHQIVGPPAVIKNNKVKEKDHAVDTNEVEVDEMMQAPEFEVEYKRYLDEIVKTLETDEAFKKKVEGSNVDDINSGKIAKELESVNQDVRSKLDELKRQEVQRLRELVRRKEELGHGPLHPSEYEHIDHINLDTFEVKDLDNLIKKVSKDMEKINELRKEQFKQYELEKHFEEELKMSNMTEKEKVEFKEQIEHNKKKHANHEKIHHPGSKAQLEEVWEKQDHLENQEFDPKIFFHLHDIDSNGYWDHEEVKALFIKELDKMYQAGLPEDDMKERQEEMERMREHVFKEMDKNGDSLISFQEYMDETKSKDFNQDEGWDTLDKQQIYSQQEYEEFQRRRVAELQSMIDQGLISPEQYPGLYNLNHPNQMPQYHPNQIPQYHPNQVPQQGYHPNQVPQHPNQMPQHPNQMAQHPNQVPQHPNQMPQHPNQMPQHPNQIPQHPNQVPQHHGQYQNQVPPHPSQQQYQQHQAYQQNQHPNQVPQQHYQPNPPYQPGDHSSQQQYQNNQQYQPNHNNQQQYQQPNHNNQQQYQQPNQNNKQQPNQNNQQPNQNNQQQQQHHQSNEQHHQSNEQHQQNNQPQANANNQQHQQQPNQNQNSQYQAGQHSNPQPPAGNH